MNKMQNLSNRTSCLNKAGAEEPLFILRAKDPQAPMAIRHWVTMSSLTQQTYKLQEALQLADRMDAWRVANFPEK